MAPDITGLIIVPYRNRPTHLACFTLYMKEHYPQYKILVVEQDDNLPWNKGLLFNAGYKEFAQDYGYLILHDVDFIPVQDKVDYSHCILPSMIAGEASQFNYLLTYQQFFGGVVVCSKEHYEMVNGFSNQFKGYGGEDDLFQRSFVQKGITTQVKMGRFECFAHPRPKREEEYRHNLQVLGAGRDYAEGLTTAQYMINSIEHTPYYTHLKITTAIQ